MNDSSHDPDARIALLKKQKDVLDAQKALLSDVDRGPYSGSVTMKGKAGSQEGALLAACAVREAAATIASAVCGAAQTFYVFGATQLPTFDNLLSFRWQLGVLHDAFAAAHVDVAPGGRGDPGATRRSAIFGAISLGLTAASNILSFFKTDYEIGGIDAELDESLLLFAVAGALRRSAKPSAVYLASLGPEAEQSALDAILVELATLAQLRAAAEGLGAAAGAIASYDALLQSLTTADASGRPPLAAIVREAALENALKAGAAVLLLRLENSGGSYLLKKNLLTSLGFAPLYYTGGATAGYVLLKGATCEVVGGDIVPVYGGFVRAGDLRRTLAAAADARALEEDERG